MIDFSKLRRLTIPEGEVKQIADKSGNVLWRYMEKLAAPVISLETVADIIKLATPTIRLDVVEDYPILPDEPIKLAAPTITLYVEPVIPDEPDEPDEPEEPVQLTAPTIRLEVIEDEPDVPIEPEEPKQLDAPVIRLDVAPDEDEPEVPVKLAAPVISLYTEPVEPDVPVLTKLAAPTIEIEVIEPIVLEVEKITNDTYAAETTYEDEQFILLDIYPEAADSVVDVTYGGLTKRLTFSGTNAQQVFFGTFNGVSDEVETPASGTLTIEGECGNFGVGAYDISSKSEGHCDCITAIKSWGSCRPTSIVEEAFYNCNNLTLTELPKSITRIERSAFWSCRDLALEALPDGVTDIEGFAFHGCDMLSLTSLPSKLISIGDCAFDGNFLRSGMTVVIPASVGNIGNNPWVDCSCDIVVEEGNERFAVDGMCLIDKYENRLIYGRSESVIPNYITSIAGYAFQGKSFSSTELPSGVTSIGRSAFEDCRSISITTLPSGITTLEDYVFRNCVNITTITIPSGVTKIGTQSLYISTYDDHRTMTMLGEIPPELDDDASIGMVGAVTIIVPVGCGEAYKTAKYWSEHADYITEATA